MKKQDVINNIMASYRDCGMTEEVLEGLISSGEKQGFSYQTIYTGIRMMLGEQNGREELFSAAEVAEALGMTEDEVIQEIEQLNREIVEAGENPDQYIKKCDPVQRFVIPPSKYLS